MPDYIHAYDSAFLLRFVDHWSCYEHPIQVVHDCFGTTIDHVETMQRSCWISRIARFHSNDFLVEHQTHICSLKCWWNDCLPEMLMSCSTRSWERWTGTRLQERKAVKSALVQLMLPLALATACH